MKHKGLVAFLSLIMFVVGGLAGVLNAVPVDLLLSPVLEWDTQVFKNMVKYAELQWTYHW